MKQDDSDSKDLPVPGQTDHLCISRIPEIMNTRNEMIGGTSNSSSKRVKPPYKSSSGLARVAMGWLPVAGSTSKSGCVAAELTMCASVDILQVVV